MILTKLLPQLLVGVGVVVVGVVVHYDNTVIYRLESNYQQDPQGECNDGISM